MAKSSWYDKQQAKRDEAARIRAKQKAKQRELDSAKKDKLKEEHTYKDSRGRDIFDQKAYQAAINEMDQAKRDEKKARNQRIEDNRAYIKNTGLIGGIGTKVGDEYKTYRTDERSTQERQEALLNDQYAKRQKDLERWNAKKEEGADWAQSEGFDDLKSGHHWSQQSIDNYQRMQDYQANGGYKTQGYINYAQPATPNQAQKNAKTVSGQNKTDLHAEKLAYYKAKQEQTGGNTVYNNKNTGEQFTYDGMNKTVTGQNKPKPAPKPAVASNGKIDYSTLKVGDKVGDKYYHGYSHASGGHRWGSSKPGAYDVPTNKPQPASNPSQPSGQGSSSGSGSKPAVIPMFLPDGKGGFKPNTDHPDHASQQPGNTKPSPQQPGAGSGSKPAVIPMFLPDGKGGFKPNTDHPDHASQQPGYTKPSPGIDLTKPDNYQPGSSGGDPVLKPPGLGETIQPVMPTQPVKPSPGGGGSTKPPKPDYTFQPYPMPQPQPQPQPQQPSTGVSPTQTQPAPYPTPQVPQFTTVPPQTTYTPVQTPDFMSTYQPPPPPTGHFTQQPGYQPYQSPYAVNKPNVALPYYNPFANFGGQFNNFTQQVQ